MILTIHQKGKTVKMVNMKQNSLLLKDAKSTGASSAPDLLEIIIVLLRSSITRLNLFESMNFIRNFEKKKNTIKIGLEKKKYVVGRIHDDDDDFWCLTPLSSIFLLYHGDQF